MTKSPSAGVHAGLVVRFTDGTCERPKVAGSACEGGQLKPAWTPALRGAGLRGEAGRGARGVRAAGMKAQGLV